MYPRGFLRQSTDLSTLSGFDVELFEDHIDIALEFIIIGQIVLDLISSVHDGGVILFAKHLGDRVISDIRIVLAQIHDHLSGNDDLTVLLLGHDRRGLDAVVVADNAHDPVRSHHIILFGIDHILESFLGVFDGDLYIIKSGISSDLLDRSLKLPDIGFNIGSDVFKNLIVHIEVATFFLRIAILVS